MFKTIILREPEICFTRLILINEEDVEERVDLVVGPNNNTYNNSSINWMSGDMFKWATQFIFDNYTTFYTSTRK